VQDAIVAARAAGIEVKLNAVLSAVSAPHLDVLLAFVEREDLALTVNIMRSGAPDLHHDAATIKADDREIARVLRRLEELSRRNPRLLFSPRAYRYASRWGAYGHDRIEKGDVPDDDPRLRQAPPCHAGRSYLSINPDGTVFPCSQTINRLPGAMSHAMASPRPGDHSTITRASPASLRAWSNRTWCVHSRPACCGTSAAAHCGSCSVDSIRRRPHWVCWT
jgi:radical SAM protein with 4Fe4S-binding SPASM domain